MVTQQPQISPRVMSDARLTTESHFTSPSPLLLTPQSVFCGDTKLHANIHRAITSQLKNE